MATNITVLTNVGTNNTNVQWDAPVQQTTILDTTNPQFVRAVQLSNDGVKITRGLNFVGINTSTIIAAAIQVNPALTWPPFFNTQPTADQIVNRAAVAHAAVSANSEVSLTYQWQYTNNAANSLSWTNISNSADFANVTSNNVTVNVTANIATLAGYYRVRVVGAAGSNNSNAAIINMLGLASSASVNAPNPANISIVAYGIGPFTYQWQRSTDGGNTFSNVANGAPFTNVTTNILAISNSTGLNGNQFRCGVSDSNVSMNSTIGVLTVT